MQTTHNTRTEAAALERGEWHGVAGQLNGLVLDAESACTGYGAHNRLVGPFGSLDRNTVTVREDVEPGVARAGVLDVLQVALGPLRIHPRGTRLQLVGSIEYENIWGRFTSAVEHEFRVIRPATLNTTK